ncbi:MAG: HD domain-containing protein [Candidatus Nitrosotenuis sp.]
MKQLKLLELEVKKRLLNDPAHDYSHIMRVYKNAKLILKHENANNVLVMASVLLHDIINFPKSDPRSKYSSTKSATLASRILRKYDFSNEDIMTICDAIRDHSFSRGKIPKTIEGKILQDADRLDALGAIGIARVFTVGGFEQRFLYNYSDPFCKNRKPDDRIWTVDHFYRKLLTLEKKMNTKTGKKLAKQRKKIMINFLSQMQKEIT